MSLSVPHPDHLRPLYTLVFFLVEPPVMIFRLYDHGGTSTGAVAAGWQEQYHDEDVKRDFFHEAIEQAFCCIPGVPVMGTMPEP